MSVLGTVIVGIVILIGVIGAVVQVWPSDMLLRIAGDLGFGDELEEIIA